MSHHHEHHDCHGDHALKLCKKCNIVYCANCHEEWFKSWTQDWQIPHYTTWPPYRNDVVSTTGTPFPNPVTTTCDHT